MAPETKLPAYPVSRKPRARRLARFSQTALFNRRAKLGQGETMPRFSDEAASQSRQ